MKRVVVIASGETERRALPHLVAHLREEGITLTEVRIPTGNRALDREMAERLVKTAWYAPLTGEKPDKIVILVDVDGKQPAEVLDRFEPLAQQLAAKVQAAIRFAYAQWHLEAWFFGDNFGLKRYLGGLGNLRGAAPDEIENPKLCLKHLLQQRRYTAVVSEEIARELNPRAIEECSPSFSGFLEAVRNGGAESAAPSG